MLNPLVVQSMTPTTGGFASSVWRVETPAGRFALRTFAPHQSAVLEREYIALRAADAAHLPIARMHALGTWHDRPSMLLDWAAGRPLLDALQAEPWRLVQLGLEFGRVQRALHQIPAPPELRADWLNWPRPAEPAVAQRLHDMPLRTDRLVHLDYHPLNVIVDGAQITAVIDWTNVHRGDPRADLARTLSILRLLPLDASRSQRAGARLLELAWRLGYGPFGPDMDAFYAWAGGAMLHDLAGRYSEQELEPVRRWTLSLR